MLNTIEIIAVFYLEMGLVLLYSNQGLLVIKGKLCSAMCNQVFYILCVYQAKIIR